LLVFRFQCFDATVYTVNKVVQSKPSSEICHNLRKENKKFQIFEIERIPYPVESSCVAPVLSLPCSLVIGILPIRYTTCAVLPWESGYVNVQ